MKFALAAILVLTIACTLLMSSKPARAGSAPALVFQAVPTPNQNFNNGLFAVSASSPNDIWAVGDAVIHYDGTKWTAIKAPNIGSNGTLNGVADISATEAWAVGTVNVGMANPGQIIERWDGTQWKVFSGPKFGRNEQPSLRAMTAVSAKDIWAVGSHLSDDQQQLFFLFEHWDGISWKATSILSGDAFLFGISGDATNDVWSVGFSGPENDDSRTLAMHFDGANWTTATTPSVGNGANQLNGVLALAPNNVWAVGFSTPDPPPTEDATLTLIEHFDGTQWSVVPSPNVGPGSIFQSNRLFGITGTSANDLWAFGSYFAGDGSGHQKTLLMHWNGTKWTLVPSPNPTNGVFPSDLLFAGVVPSPGNIWIVGGKDIPPHEETLAIHSTRGGDF